MKFLLFLFFLCSGCGENRLNEKTSSMQDDKDFHEICRRVGGLDMTVVATGSGISKQSVSSMQDLVQKYGLNIPGSALINRDIFAGADTDDRRLNHFIDAINSDHKIIWAIRGGYGSSRLIATLDRTPKPKDSKIFIGFCDATSLNLFISQKWPNWKVIHGSSLIFLTPDSSSNKFETLMDILEGKISTYEIRGIYPLNNKARLQSSVVGPLTGGNLTIIENSLKTCWEIQTDGKILFIEDTHEEPQHIYRSLYHLKEAGKLSKVKALVLGHFHGAKYQDGLEPYLKGFAQTLDIPVYATDQFGHGDFNMPIVYNAAAKIHGNEMTIDLKF
ncbi:MAG: LD-carboxypeptidase [Holosporaceae bacterium]|jgi:muramoyltetrapeptide carboxypeptidase|nr:LD-carboxypeptidase [Holosporaceae bacterium]